MLSQFVFVLKIKIKQAFDEAFGYLKRVIVTPAVYLRLFEFHHFDIQLLTRHLATLRES